MRNLALDLRRLALVVWVVARASSGALLRYLLGLPQNDPPYPVRIRLALERLGTTYLKLGQFMAMRFDILPMEVCVELRKLFEEVPQLRFATVRDVIEAELRKPLHQAFLSFREEPIAAASIAQVHEARSFDNERLAVKVQRPGIAVIFESDMRILGKMAALVDWSGWSPGIVAKDVIGEFAAYTRREMNFILEAETGDRLRRNASEHEYVPQIHWHLTTRKVLTMEFIEGLSVSQASRLLHEQGIDAIHARLRNFALKKVLHRFAYASLRQLFTTGFFHADPHPGNILLLHDSKIAFVDFGIFGSLTEERRQTLTGYIENAAIGNINESFRHYAKLSMPSGQTDLESFKRETKAVLQRWYDSSNRLGASMRERHVGTVIGDITDVLRRHSVRVDMDTLLFWRAAIALDSSALGLSDRFDLIREMRSFFSREQRPLGERILATALDRGREAALVEATVAARRLCAETLDDVSTGHYALPVSTADGADRRGREKWEGRAVSLALLAASALPLALLLDDAALRAAAVAGLLVLQLGVVFLSGAR
jgi:ubiquinone biosynthesis protein